MYLDDNRFDIPRQGELLVLVARTKLMQQSPSVLLLILDGRVFVQADVPCGAASTLIRNYLHEGKVKKGKKLFNYLGKGKLLSTARHLNHELSLNVRVEYPQALLMVERVEREGLREVAGVQLARVRRKSLLAAHRVGDKVVRRFIREALGGP